MAVRVRVHAETTSTRPATNDTAASLPWPSPPRIARVCPPWTRPEFCAESIANDTAYRWDGIHYYKKGAALYFSAVLPQLLQV